MNTHTAHLRNHRCLLNNNQDGTAERLFVRAIIVVTIIVVFFSLVECFRQICRLSRSLNHGTAALTTPCHCAGLAAIPVYIYGAPSSTFSSSSSSSFEQENCTICLGEFVHGEAVRVLPRCKHMFHKDCIDLWLPLRSLHCPICRDSTIEQDVRPTRTNCMNGAAGSPSELMSAPNFAISQLPSII